MSGGGRARRAVAGLVLAAGGGTRMGAPKALLRDAEGTAWVARACAALRDGGCDEVTVVLGAAADEARALVPPWARVATADDWAEGMGASLRAGLDALSGGGRGDVDRLGSDRLGSDRTRTDQGGSGQGGAGQGDSGQDGAGQGGSGQGGAEDTGAGRTGEQLSAVVVTLVDLPGVGAPVVARVLADVVRGRGEREVRAALARACYAGRAGHPVLLGRDHWAGVVEGARGDAGARAYLRARDVTLVECADIGAGDDVDTPADRLRLALGEIVTWSSAPNPVDNP